MLSGPQARRIIPLILGVGMLSVIIASVVFPNLGEAPAQSSCGYPLYPPCASSTTSWEYGAIAAVVIVVALAFVLVYLQSHRRPPAATGPVQPWKGGGGPGAGPSTAPTGPSTPPVPPPIAAPVYLETPGEVAQEPPTPPGRDSAVATSGSPVATEPRPDDDPLVAELDRISREVQKRARKKAAPPPSESTEPTETEPPH